MKKTPIDKWLFNNGMTQKDLAEALNYDYPYLNQVLNLKKPLSVKLYTALKKMISKKIVDEHFGL